jgi:hypothetical protein
MKEELQHVEWRIHPTREIDSEREAYGLAMVELQPVEEKFVQQLKPNQFRNTLNYCNSSFTTALDLIQLIR